MQQFAPERSLFTRPAALAVLLLAAVLFFGRLGGRSLWSEEARWAEIPREMQLTGQYLWPAINGRTYYDKPLGSYWLVLAASWVHGGIDETAARLPCAVAGALGVILVMLIARRLFDERTAILAGLILATSFSFVFFSRNASTDVETVTGILAALWLFLRNEKQPDGWWIVWLWLVMALTSLTKGLPGFVLPVLVIGCYSTLTAGPGSFVARNRWLFNRKSLLAIPIGVLVYLLPFLLSPADGLGMVYRENIRRFVDPVNHRGPVWLYVPVLFLLMVPWSFLLPAALVQAHHRIRRGGDECRGDRFALVYFWAIFVFFTLASSRRSYYLLPILPAGALLTARLLACSETLKRLAQRLLTAGHGLIALAALLSIVLLLPATKLLPAPLNSLPGLPYPAVFLLMWSVCAICLIRARKVVSLGAIAAAFMTYLFLFAAPGVERYRTRRPFAEAVKERLGPHLDELALYHHREIVYYLGRSEPLPEYHTAQELAHGNVHWLIAPRRELAALSITARVVLAEKDWPWESPADAQRKLVLLDMRTVHSSPAPPSGVQ